MNMTRRSPAWTVVLLTFTLGGVLRAQQNVDLMALPVEVTGTADMGGSFQGTLLLTRFESFATNDGIVAIGTMIGSLNGRSLATKVAIPVTVTSGTASLTTVGSPASCDTIRVAIEPSTFRVLGSVVTLARSSVDVTAAQDQLSGSANSPTAAAAVTTVSSGIGTLGMLPALGVTSGSAGTLIPTSPVGSATPGVISPPPQTRSPAIATSLQQLGQSLCAVSGLAQSSSPPAQLAGALNRVMLALQQ